MRTADFEFELPPDLIAQAPAMERDQSRLLVLDRASGQVRHRRFRDLAEHFQPGDVLVLNDSRVIPARLRGTNTKTGGHLELLLIEEVARNDWWVMLRPGKRAQLGTRIRLHHPRNGPSELEAAVVATNAEGHRRLQFFGVPDILEALDTLGEIPLPPYIQRDHPGTEEEDRERYQTVFAQHSGSVAAPTAGLHFTSRVLDEIQSHGVRLCYVTLHVGLGTFAPVKAETLTAHKMHKEKYNVPAATATIVNESKNRGGRVIAVGTTSLRVLESVAARHQGCLIPGGGSTDIFIYPPYRFKLADALLTNFHLPRSTLLMLVSAFATPGEDRGGELTRNVYAEAVRERYRFFSYGDAMLIL